MFSLFYRVNKLKLATYDLCNNNNNNNNYKPKQQHVYRDHCKMQTQNPWAQ